MEIGRGPWGGAAGVVEGEDRLRAQGKQAAARWWRTSWVACSRAPRPKKSSRWVNNVFMCERVRVRACACACVRVCVHVCVRVRVRARPCIKKGVPQSCAALFASCMRPDHRRKVSLLTFELPTCSWLASCTR